MRHPGIVYLVGAGPGNPDLITVRGLLCLRDADVVMHDRSIYMHLLEEARPTAEIINVGKEYGGEDEQQECIHHLMIEKSREGKNVCRLKGGDPFVFGRGGEEARALSEAGVPFEIVPGVSSAIAVPAYAGIPVTDRDHAHAFMVITGSRSHDLESPEWHAAAALVRAGGTVIVMMGLARINAIADQLVSFGCPATMPVGVIGRGSYLIQDCRVGTLGAISQQLTGVKGPATIVIGEVVSLRDRIQWMELATKFGSE